MLIKGEDAESARTFTPSRQTHQPIYVLLIRVVKILDVGSAVIDKKLETFEIEAATHLWIDKGVVDASSDGENVGVKIDGWGRVDACEIFVYDTRRACCGRAR